MEKSVHNYSAYGLRIRSDFEFPELPPAVGTIDTDPDVHIVRGTVPESLENADGKGVLYEAAADEFLLRMPDIARYLVRNGNEIVIDEAPNALPMDVRVFMLGSCVGALLHQREMLVLHASAIRTEKGAVLFAGNSGAGKSTLLGAMLDRGYRMIVDDVCGAVDGATDDVEVLSGYPRTRLWADAAERLEVETDGLDRTRPTIEKFERQVPDAFWPDPSPMRQLYVLNSHNDDAITIEELPTIDAFAVVLHHTYRRLFLEGLQMRAPHFQLASKVASGVRICRVTRPSGSFKLEELADAIELDLAST